MAQSNPQCLHVPRFVYTVSSFSNIQHLNICTISQISYFGNIYTSFIKKKKKKITTYFIEYSYNGDYQLSVYIYITVITEIISYRYIFI